MKNWRLRNKGNSTDSETGTYRESRILHQILGEKRKPLMILTGNLRIITGKKMMTDPILSHSAGK